MSNSSWRRRGRKPRQAPPIETEILVDRLGAGGDGVSAWQGKPVYAAGLLPGERARVRLGAKRGDGRVAEVLAIEAESADRTAPPCPYAEDCGGCAMQHMADAAYAEWKSGLLTNALRARQVTPEHLHPMLRIDEGRRRIRLAAIGRTGGVIIGFNAKASSQIVDIAACIAADDGLAGAPTVIRPLLDRLLKPGEPCDIEALSAAAGLDLMIIRKRPFDMAEREAIARFAGEAGVARITWRPDDRDEPEIVAERALPSIDIGVGRVTLTPGAFLQPTAGGEAAMAAFAAERLAGAGRIADLYSGWGAFALRLGNPAHVAAFEGDAGMVASLNRAAGVAGLGEFVAGRVRDLARQPLLAEDMKGLDGVVLDPPRSGAAAQAAALAADGPPKIVYLSCNPAAFARDARTLIDGGYRLVEAMPIDQFRWTPHLEVAAYFERPPRADPRLTSILSPMR